MLIIIALFATMTTGGAGGGEDVGAAAGVCLLR